MSDEVLNRYFQDLRSRHDEVRALAAAELRDYIEREGREMSSELFTLAMNNLIKKIFDLVNSSEPHEKLGGILVIDELIDVLYEENETKIIRFAQYLRMIFQQSNSNENSMDQRILKEAAAVLGHLARSGGTLAADTVEFEVKRALEWLEGDRSEQRRYAAVLVLKELAENTPTLFNVHVEKFISHIWVTLRDPKLQIREAAISALRVCLLLIRGRGSESRTERYRAIYSELQVSLKSSSSECIHGALLTLRELLAFTKDFMISKYKEVIESVIKFRDHKDRLVRETVISLLPKLAEFQPDQFIHGYLEASVQLILGTLKRNESKEIAFVALGELAVAVKEAILPELNNIILQCKLALNADKKGKFINESLTCIGLLAQAISSKLVPYMNDLIELMFSGGISATLVEALKNLCSAIPSMLSQVQERLLAALNSILASNSSASGKDKDRRSTALTTRFTSLTMNTLTGYNSSLNFDSSSSGNADLIYLALDTLGQFDFRSYNLLPFVRDIVLSYLDHENAKIRNCAARTCAALILRPSSVMDQDPAADQQLVLVGNNFEEKQKMESEDDNRINIIMENPTAVNSSNPSDVIVSISASSHAMICEVIERLLSVGIADPDPRIRKTVLESLDSRFDQFLGQSENVHSLFVSLNDEVFAIREVAMSVIGRLAVRNPAYVMPSLRKTLIQLLTEVQYGGDARNREESAMLLGHLIGSSQSLIKPYVGPMLKVLVPKLRDPDANVASCVLATLGRLAVIGGEDMVQYLDTLLPIIIGIIQDKSSMIRRDVALRTLAELVQSTGYVIQPYIKYPNLLNTILTALKSGQTWKVRREVMKLLGILGALDPHTHKTNQALAAAATASAADSSSEHNNAAANAGQPAGAKDGEEKGKQVAATQDKTELIPSMSRSSDDYYPTVAIYSLMRILRDPALQQHHNQVIQAVMFIVKSLGSKCVPFLPLLVPPFLHVMRNSQGETLRETIFKQLGFLVSIVRTNIRPYLDGIFEMIHLYWHEANLLGEHILPLVEKICLGMREEFRVYLPGLLPLMLTTLHSDKSPQRQLSLKLLHAFEVFGANLGDYLHLVVPAVVRLAESHEAAQYARGPAIHTIGYLCRILNLCDYASRIIHPIARILESSGAPSTSAFSSGASSSKSTLREEIMQTLCLLVYQLGSGYAIFVPMMAKVLGRQNYHHPNYEFLVNKILNNQSLQPSDIAQVKFASKALNAIMELKLNEDAADEEFEAAAGGAAGKREDGGLKKVAINQQSLKKAWNVQQRSTKDDWVDWFRGFSIELLKYSPSPALRACAQLAQKYDLLARELFNAAFISVWGELEDKLQDDLVDSLEKAFNSPHIPPELLQMLLNLAEFMERDGKRLPIDIQRLGALAESCHAYAKALHYKELEFVMNPSAAIESLISINNQLQQPEASVGILNLARQHHQLELKESWYEKLQRWEEALEAYERKQLEMPNNVEMLMGRMRCLRALGEWERLAILTSDLWQRTSPMHDEAIRREIAPLAASAAWNLNRWDQMPQYLSAMEQERSEAQFFHAIMAVHRNEVRDARAYIDRTRELLDLELAALVGESYSRAYRVVVQVQQMAELEEILRYKECRDKDQKALIRKMWSERLKGCHRNVDVWQQILVVRSIVVSPKEDIPTWLKFSSLCRKSGRLALSLKVLTNLLGVDPHRLGNDAPLPTAHPQVTYAYLKHLWSAGYQQEACSKMSQLVEFLKDYKPQKDTTLLNDLGIAGPESSATSVTPANGKAASASNSLSFTAKPRSTDSSSTLNESELARLKARAYLRLGNWQLQLTPLNNEVIPKVLACFQAATLCDGSYKVWQNWAVMNFRVVSHYKALKQSNQEAAESPAKSNLPLSKGINPLSGKADSELEKKIISHAVPAVRGFFRSISLAGDQSLQDILRLLTLWFDHGMHAEVEAALAEGFNLLPIDTWLSVIPQIIARIDTKHANIRRMISELLCKIGKSAPQALVYPLAVVAKSQSVARKTSALNVMNNMRQHSPVLVEQALMVSRELIRVAILWHEIWHEALEEASRLWFGQKNVEGMFATLGPLHEMMAKGPQTLREIGFVQAYGRDLAEASEWCIRYTKTNNDSDLNQAWDIYVSVFRRINKTLQATTDLELQYVSPKLLAARDLELAMPGTFLADRDSVDTHHVLIQQFLPSLKVIESKQRPRKIGILGSDGREYAFLLKGHEDLRQDKRVMQLFGLVNTLLANDTDTSKKDLKIRGYSVIPLAPNSGLIQWLNECDTVHALIKDYRDARKVLLNIEHRLMLQMAPDYQNLTLMQKVEVFEYALARTTGQDLSKVLWLKSQNSEIWLDRRTNYTRSLAVMSMVGYILGLGDRHPCNIMLERQSFRLLHIDFGDCFEVAMVREKFPEKIPFRLTRMLVNAMEVSGIEGTFRSTAESVMKVLRNNKESVEAVLEAFVYDPLINWRLLTNKKEMHEGPETEGLQRSELPIEADKIARSVSSSGTSLRAASSAVAAYGPDGEGDNEDSEMRNAKALSVMARVRDKLNGKDFGEEVLSIEPQVENLIKQATSHINLCQCYIGWCPFW